MLRIICIRVRTKQNRRGYFSKFNAICAQTVFNGSGRFIEKPVYVDTGSDMEELIRMSSVLRNEWQNDGLDR